MRSRSNSASIPTMLYLSSPIAEGTHLTNVHYRSRISSSEGKPARWEGKGGGEKEQRGHVLKTTELAPQKRPRWSFTHTWSTEFSPQKQTRGLCMMYTSRIPSPPLDSYIDDLYYLEGPAPHSRLKTFPMPSLHLMVNFGQAFSVFLSDQAHPIAHCTQSWWVGMFSTSHIVDWPSRVQFFGVHFKPGGAAPFLPLPLSELHNQVVALDALWGQFAAEMRERLYDAPTIQAGFALFEQLLLDRLSWTPQGFDLVQYAIGEMTHHRGALSIRTLSEQLGISQNYLNTQFKRLIGISPKEFARLS